MFPQMQLFKLNTNASRPFVFTYEKKEDVSSQVAQ